MLQLKISQFLRVSDMLQKDKSIEKFTEMLSQRSYRRRTILTYTKALESLFDYYRDVVPEKLVFQQISDYIFYLTNRKKDSSIISVSVSCCV